MNTIYTIGHSNHSIADFIAMLYVFEVKLLVDIRSVPASGRNPQFSKSALESSLKDAGIDYLHLPQLGGRGIPGSSLPGYPGYMSTEPFIKGIDQLLIMATKKQTAYMCAEALWSHCHRSYISDCLTTHNWEVIHIMDKQKSSIHTPVIRQGSLFA